MYSPETQARLAALRQKVADGTITEAEMAEGIRLLRGDRIGAQVASDTSRRKKAVAVIPSADDLLTELSGDSGNE